MDVVTEIDCIWHMMTHRNSQCKNILVRTQKEKKEDVFLHSMPRINENILFTTINHINSSTFFSFILKNLIKKWVIKLIQIEKMV